MIFIFLKFTFNYQEQSYLADKYRGGNVMKIEDYWKDVTIYVTEFIVNQGTEKKEDYLDALFLMKRLLKMKQ